MVNTFYEKGQRIILLYDYGRDGIKETTATIVWDNSNACIIAAKVDNVDYDKRSVEGYQRYDIIRYNQIIIRAPI